MLSRLHLCARILPKNDAKRRTHPVHCSVDVPLTYRHSIQRDTVRIAATVAVHFEFGSSFFHNCIYFSILFCICQDFFPLFPSQKWKSVLKQPQNHKKSKKGFTNRCFYVILYGSSPERLFGGGSPYSQKAARQIVFSLSGSFFVL